jgi:hypothetical protein
MKLTRCGLLMALTVALGTVRAANAASIAGSMAEPFDYATGTLFPNPSTLNGGAGWNANGTTDPNVAASLWGSANNGGNAAGTFRTATTPGLTSSATGYLAATGNKLTLDAVAGAANQNIGRAFGGQSIDAGTTYFSYLTSKNNDTIRSINLAFFNGTTERFAIGQISGAAAVNQTAGNLALLMNNSNPTGLIQNPTPIAYGVGVTHLIVGKIVWNASGFETVSIWVDPTDVTTEAAAGAVYLSTSGFELTAITGIRPFVGLTANGFTSSSANFDEFRLGGTWEAATSQAVAASPEPTSALLFALSGLALGAFRKRS